MSRVAQGKFTVQSELGMHARPAGRFVSLASTVASEISVGRGDEWVNGCSVLSILSLAAGQGTVLHVKAEGEDADEAVAQLGALIEAAEEPAA